jgi:hypothetical protein
MPKSLVLFFFFLLTAHLSISQQFQKFRVGIGAGYIIATGDGAGGGGLVALEPGFHITDRILANAKLERAVFVRGTDKGSSLEIDYGRLLSGSINLQYYINNAILRPFVGGGFGFYNIDALTIDVSNVPTDVPAESKLGLYPRIGFDVAHFTISIDYNIVPPTKVGLSEYKNNFFAIRIGGFFGGGRKN